MTGYSTITLESRGLVWQQVFLPENAPPEWQDREILWNAVEENEKTKDSRLAREIIVALPKELSPPEWQALLTDYIQDNFVSDGMCVDVCIHDTDGRFSRSNKEWAQSISLPFVNTDYIVQSHSAVLDGFINQVRKLV